MSNIVHIVGVKNAFYVVIGVWLLGAIVGLNYVSAQASEFSNAMTRPAPPPATTTVAAKN